MKTELFNYDLPESFIAQNPVSPRDSSKLMIYDVSLDEVKHDVFKDVFDYLKKGDVLVVNRSKVIPARILFSDGGKEFEIFILAEEDGGFVHAMVYPGKAFFIGAHFYLGGGVSCEVLEVNDDGTRRFKFVGDYLSLGDTPLPPYIHDSRSSSDDYQTVYAKEKGSVAAPTAGLHFTPDLIERLKDNGVVICEVVLHVGRGTFLPIWVDDIRDHEMHEEFYTIDEKAASILNNAKVSGNRVIAVGTTSVRVLESAYRDSGFVAENGSTDIFIYPGYRWKVVNGLITNFHLPRSTLIMLVASFLENKGATYSVKQILNLYEIAKAEKYRFYSFGDAMLLL